MNGSEGTMEMSRENMNNIRKQSLTLQEKISSLVKELDEKRWVQADYCESRAVGRSENRWGGAFGNVVGIICPPG